jgi:hypothetical protein
VNEIPTVTDTYINEWTGEHTDIQNWRLEVPEPRFSDNTSKFSSFFSIAVNPHTGLEK